MANSKPKTYNSFDLSRKKGSSPLGTTLFIGFRALDVFIQYSILTNHLASPLLDFLSIPHIPSFWTSAPSAVALGLPIKPLVVLGMAAGTALKQIYWISALSNEEMPLALAAQISTANTIFNSFNSILSLTALSAWPTASDFWGAPTELTTSFLVSSFTYLVGAVVEVTAEIQRKKFKQDPKNKGKPFTGGVFGWVRHANYGAYTVMRASYAIACGGWIAGAGVAAFFGLDFANRGVPVLDHYCSERYGEDWKLYKQKVQYKLFPGIY